MYTRLDKIPTLHTCTESLDVRQFNSVRLGLIRYGTPLRLELAGLRGMDILLRREQWICVDRTLFDLPVIAWDHFGTQDRQVLPLYRHPVIRCRVRHYHVDAIHIGRIILTAAADAIGNLFERDRPHQSADILRPFPAARLSNVLIRAALAEARNEAGKPEAGKVSSSDPTPVSG